ncbi:MAG: endonuclease III [Chloroflexi bacterium]|nr:endonuclease III [Chloroflexota bacterium]
MSQPRIKRIIELLAGDYGAPVWVPDHEPVATLIQTILSQNTSDTNSHRAFQSLMKAFPDWETMAEADVAEIETAIKVGGLANIKAARLKEVLIRIKEARDRINLDFLEKLSINEAREWLKQLPGVGTKTASCVLLFSLGKPSLPVDTHIYRVSVRLGLVPATASVEKAHELLGDLVPADYVYQFHVLTIEHGRRVCKARRPLCHECVLQKLCPSYGQFH